MEFRVRGLPWKEAACPYFARSADDKVRGGRKVKEGRKGFFIELPLPLRKRPVHRVQYLVPAAVREHEVGVVFAEFFRFLLYLAHFFLHVLGERGNPPKEAHAHAVFLVVLLQPFGKLFLEKGDEPVYLIPVAQEVL